MRVKIEYTVDVPDKMREAMVEYGCLESDDKGRATREAVKNWYRNHGEALDLDLVWMKQDDEHEEEDLSEEIL